MNRRGLVTAPPLVTTVIHPVVASCGTVTITPARIYRTAQGTQSVASSRFGVRINRAGLIMTRLSLLTANFAGLLRLHTTRFVCVKLVPDRITLSPGLPLSGLMRDTLGSAKNASLLVTFPLSVVTVTKPVAAPAGTTASR